MEAGFDKLDPFHRPQGLPIAHADQRQLQLSISVLPFLASHWRLH
jgi:hypothetical protein